MANNTQQNNPTYQVVNGLKYFKLQSPYPSDYTKNCGLLGNEIDENFFFLRGYDIEDMSIEDGILTLKRVDGDILTADVSSTYTFEFDKENGKLIITDNEGNEQILDGFAVQEDDKDMRVATNDTIEGDGTKENPLRVSKMEKTGTYSPADEYINLVVYDYFVKIYDEPNDSYYYESIEKSDIPSGADIVEYQHVPTEGVTYESPEYIKVKEDLELPDGRHLGKGYRIVTRETRDNFGLLYDFEGVEKIMEALEETGSLWRVPTRKDWADMLNAAEYCEEDRNHDTHCVNEWTGKNAGARAKSINIWKYSEATEGGISVLGEDNLPEIGENTFRVYPLGNSDSSLGAQDKDFDVEGFRNRGSFWTSSRTVNCSSCNSNVFTITFGYDTRKVLHESSKPSSRMSLRLVKDYEPGEMKASEIENILGYTMPCVFISNKETGYSKIWTSVNVGFKNPEFSGATAQEWETVTGRDRGVEIVFYVNEWDGTKWNKKLMTEGDSIVIMNTEDESGETAYNHEWRIYKYDGIEEPVLVDTAVAIKEEFQEEIDEINSNISSLSGTVDSITIVETEPSNPESQKSYKLYINGVPKEGSATIDIPNDKTIKEITLGHIGATVNEDTGEITDGPEENDKAILIVYHNGEGKYSISEIDIEEFLEETEFKDGLCVENHIVKVKIDVNSESFLTVSPSGITLSGVQDSINNSVSVETNRATAVEQEIENNIETLNGNDIKDDDYIMTINGLDLKRKNNQIIHIDFSGNFGNNMPTKSF